MSNKELVVKKVKSILSIEKLNLESISIEFLGDTVYIKGQLDKEDLQIVTIDDFQKVVNQLIYSEIKYHFELDNFGEDNGIVFEKLVLD